MKYISILEFFFSLITVTIFFILKRCLFFPKFEVTQKVFKSLLDKKENNRLKKLRKKYCGDQKSKA